MKKIKQGQTKWQVVHYKPYSLEGQWDYLVSLVCSCYITKVQDWRVHFIREGKSHWCSKYYWDNYMQDTFRKAYRKAQQEHYKLYDNTSITY